MICLSWSSSLVFAWSHPGLMEGEGADGDKGGAGFASNRFNNPPVPDRLEPQVEVAILGRCCNAR